MGIVGSESSRNRPFWTNEPLYRLNDCECGASQHNRDVYFIYGGACHEPGFWVVKCRVCGKIVRGNTQEEAAKNWNGGDAERYLKP